MVHTLTHTLCVQTQSAPGGDLTSSDAASNIRPHCVDPEVSDWIGTVAVWPLIPTPPKDAPARSAIRRPTAHVQTRASAARSRRSTTSIGYVLWMLHGGLPGCRAPRAYRLRGSPAQPRATTFSIAFETFCRRAGSASATAAPRPLRHHPPPRSRSRPAPGRVVCRRRKAPRSSTCPHRRPQGLSPEPLPIDGSRHQAMLSPPKVAA